MVFSYTVVVDLIGLTDESRHKLQSTENFIDATKTIQIPDDHKLVYHCSPVFHCNVIKNSTVELPLPKHDIMDLLNYSV